MRDSLLIDAMYDNLLLIASMGVNTKIHKDIDKVYSKDEYNYYKAYSNSRQKDSIYKSIYNVKNEGYINKLIGIYEYEFNKGIIKGEFFKLVGKSFKEVYSYFKRNDAINVPQLVLNIHTANYVQSNKESKIYGDLLSLPYLADVMGKPLIDYTVSGLYDKHIENLSRFELIDRSMQNLKLSDKDKIAEMVKDKGLDIFKLNKNMVDSCLWLENIIEDVTINNLAKRYNCKGREVLYTGLVGVDEYFEVRQGLFATKQLKAMGIVTSLMISMGVDSLDIASNVKINGDIVDDIIAIVYSGYKLGQVEEDEIAMVFSFLLEVYIILENYKECKKLYLENSKDEYFKEIEAKQRVLEEREAKIKRDEDKIESYRLEVKELQKQISDLKKESSKEIKAMEKKVRLLEKELLDKEDNSKELHALREMVYSKEVCITQETDIVSDTEVESEISNAKVTIIGGMKSLISKLKDKYPSMDFIEPSQLNKDLKYLTNKDLVVVNTGFIRHAQSDKALQTIEGTDVKLLMVNGEVNMGIVEQKMYDILVK